MYYFADPVKCRIHLTDEGLRMYHTIIHQRPGYYNLLPETDGSGYIMELECCELNIIHYFFRFRIPFWEFPVKVIASQG